MPLPQIGNDLQIRNQEHDEEYFKSRLIEADDTKYFIDLPLHFQTNAPCAFPDGHSFWVQFHAQDGSICRFTTQRTAVVTAPGVAWEIDKPTLKDVFRQQRREFVRVQVDLPVRVTVPGRVPVECETRDLSGGGMAIHLPQSLPLNANTMIDVRFLLPKFNVPVQARCFVVRMTEPDQDGRSVASVQFVELPEPVRQKIIQYTFSLQRLKA